VTLGEQQEEEDHHHTVGIGDVDNHDHKLKIVHDLKQEKNIGGGDKP